MSAGADNLVGNYRVDTFLTNYSERYVQDASTYISSRVATMIPVQNQSGYFAVWDRSYWLRDEMEPRPLGGAPVQATMGVGRKDYFIDEYALEFFVDVRQKANVQGGGAATNPYSKSDFGAVEFLTQKSLLRRDRMVATTIFNSGVWNYNYAGVAATPNATQFLAWDQTGSNPISDIDNWKRRIQLATGMRPNTMILGVDVIDKLKQNPYIVDLIKYSQIGVATEDLLAQLFGVENLVVAQSIYNSAAENVSPTTSANYQWNIPANAAWLGYIAPSSSLESPTAVIGFQWAGLTNLLGGSGEGQGIVVRRGRDDRALSDLYSVHDAINFKVASPELGAYLSAVVTAR